jgi:hypothetical protein
MGGPINIPRPTNARPWPFLVPILLKSFVNVVRTAGKIPWKPETKKP